MKKKSVNLTVALSILACTLGIEGRAATIISYSADDGVGPWGEQGTGIPRLFSSTENGDGDSNGDGDIDTNGVSWRFSTSADVAASSFFSLEGGILGVGQTIEISFDINNSRADIGFTGGGETQFQIAYNFAFNPDNYFFSAKVGGVQTGVDTGIPFTDEGVDMSFTLRESNRFDLILTTREDGMRFEFLNQELFGTSGQIDRISIGVDSGNGSVYFNNLSIIPEPSTTLLAALGVFAGFGRRRR